jgi:hypothetical protein
MWGLPDSGLRVPRLSSNSPGSQAHRHSVQRAHPFEYRSGTESVGTVRHSSSALFVNLCALPNTLRHKYGRQECTRQRGPPSPDDLQGCRHLGDRLGPSRYCRSSALAATQHRARTGPGEDE